MDEEEDGRRGGVDLVLFNGALELTVSCAEPIVSI
jgi:hypothetical protein